jgi:hypothetical protein
MELQELIEWNKKEYALYTELCEKSEKSGFIPSSSRVHEFLVANIEALKELQLLKQPKKSEKTGEYVTAYFQFYENRMGLKPKYGGGDGKAMNEIAKYLCEVSTGNDGLAAWQYILKNWNKLTPFIANQVSVLQINKNINEILSQLKNGTTKAEQRTVSKSNDAREILSSFD